jgi:peptidoglycan/LPS O-acetylase OafA/YrhL
LLGSEVDRQGKISLRHFYIRRALRILPVYFAYMAVLWLLHLMTLSIKRPQRGWRI